MITASNNPYPSNPDPTPNKLDKGGYAGSALTLDQKIDANLAEAKALIEGVKGSTDLGSIVPTSVPTGTGPAFWRATQNGTYTNFAGLVVNANSFAVISRDAAGVFSISQTSLDLTTYAKTVDVNKIRPWVAQSYLSGDQVNHLGKDWVSNAAIVAGDVPGASSKWVERLSAYISNTAQSFTSLQKSIARKNIGAKDEFQTSVIVDASKIVLNNVGWYNTSGAYTAQSNYYSSDKTPIVGAINLYAINSGNETVATVCFFNASNVFVGFFKARKIGCYIIDEFPAGATQYTFTSQNDKYTYWCRNAAQQDINDYVSVKVNSIKVADPNLLDYTLVFNATEGYYSNSTGTVVNQAGWKRTELLDLTTNSFTISLGSYRDNGSVSHVIYFKADGNFLSKDTNFSSGQSLTNKILTPPLDAKFVAFSLVLADGLAVKYSTKISILELPSSVYPLIAAKNKKPTYNYFIDYNIFKENNLKRWVDGDYNGVTKDIVTATSTGVFSLYGFGKELNLINTGTIANKVIHMFSNPRTELKNSLRISYHFFAVSAVSGTYSIQLYNLSTSVKTVTLVLTANVVKEVNFYYDFPNGYDWTTFQRMVLYCISQPASSTLTISPLEIWDGFLQQPSFTNQLSLKESNVLNDRSGFVGARGLFIGDSISTDNQYFWKGFLSSYYGFDYVESIVGQLAPAKGGMKLYPPIAETTGSESIWYRCAGNRMAIYSFDKIILFGGTNDLNNGYDLGASTDTPYKDTDTRPTVLTWCAALKGCIEMLKRDFPTVEIVICTVLDTSGAGSTMYDATYNTREAMAIRQVQVANFYNLKCVPWFWNSGITARNTPVMTSDTIHPNSISSKGMVGCFVDTVGLK